MIATELKEIKEYWDNKYPHVLVTLYPSHGDGKHRGKMIGPNGTVDLSADTIGELICQGEQFLRNAIKR